LGGNVGEQPMGPNAKPKAGAMKVAYVGKCPGHKNSEGELAEWCVFKHDTGKILTSYGSEEAAKEGLRNMESHKHGSSPMTESEYNDHQNVRSAKGGVCNCADCKNFRKWQKSSSFQSRLLRRQADGEAAAPAPAPTKSVIAIEGYEKQRGSRFKRQMWFYVTGFSYADAGLKIKKVQYSPDKTKAKQMGKLDAQTYSDQLNSRSFGLKTKVEPA
jgi:hypothetical protein